MLYVVILIYGMLSQAEQYVLIRMIKEVNPPKREGYDARGDGLVFEYTDGSSVYLPPHEGLTVFNESGRVTYQQ